MIKSRYNSSYWALHIMPISTLFYIYRKASLHSSVKIYIISMLVFLFLYFSFLILSVSKITIDQSNRTILFRKFFFWKKLISMDLIQGYVYVREAPLHSTASTSIYLIYDDKIQDRIAGSFYSNFTELESALKSLNYLGDVKLSLSNQISRLFGRCTFRN